MVLFRVFRTSGNNLPVFRTFDRNGTLANTWIRRVKGNRHGKDELLEDLKIITRSEVELTDQGVRIKGDHRVVVKDYLGKLGF